MDKNMKIVTSVVSVIATTAIMYVAWTFYKGSKGSSTVVVTESA